jgi:two-component system, chemotaxis family, sensor kinase CheA
MTGCSQGSFVNTSEYKEVFLTEAREYLATLNNALILLEKDPSQAEAIHEIFRAAHTLKGMSATMGYEPMAHLTHQMETVLEPIRSGTQPLTPSLVNALFSCLDQLEKWIQVLSTQDSLEEEDLKATLQNLQEASETLMDASETNTTNSGFPKSEPLFFSNEEREVLSQARMNGFSVFKIAVELDSECAFKEVRAFMILKNVNEFGEIVKTCPSPEEIEKGRFPRGFFLVIVTDSPGEKIRQSLLSISEVATVHVELFRMGEESKIRENGGGRKKEATTKDTPLEAIAGEKSFVLPTVRVHTSKLDKLMALVQELAISRIRFEQVVSSRELKELLEPLSQLNHITDELQDEIMKVRLMPVKQIFERFPRMVRDLAKSLNKQVSLEMDGAEVELDRTVIEEMSEPLVHLLRNAIDHGIELPDYRVREGKESFGTIRLQARRERSYVVISVADDGKGIDPEIVRKKSVAKGLISAEDVGKLTDEEAVRLIALPGFSTLENATEISGRGVGVDVAKTKVESMGGTFRIQSRKGMGTTFILKFPLTLAIIKALLVRCGREVFAIPVVNITETIEILPSEKKMLQQQETIILREEVIPIYRLQELLEIEQGGSAIPEFENILIVEVSEARVGLLVDEVIGQQEIAIKSLDRFLKGVRGFSGATILGDGKIALILEVNSLIEDLKDRRFQAEYPLMDKDNSHATQPG